MYKEVPSDQQVTFYVRTAKKLGFISKSKKNKLTQKQLKIIAKDKTKIPIQNQVLYYNGEEVRQDSQVYLVEKAIVHVIDSRNVGKSKMKLLVKRLPQNTHIDSFQIDSNTSIDSFIQNSLSEYYQQPAEKLFFVYSGRQLKREKSFTQEHVQSGSEIFCLHQDKDQKRKTEAPSSKSSLKSFKTTDTGQTKKIEEKLEHTKIQQYSLQRQQSHRQQQRIKYKNVEQKKIFSLQSEGPSQNLIKEVQSTNQGKTQEQVRQVFQQNKKQQKKIIKSIEQIECQQLQSDEDSDNENISNEFSGIPKKLPEQYLIEQTRQRSHTKDSNHNSQSSAISQPNFKKKKKVSEIQVGNKSTDDKRQEKSIKKQSSNGSYIQQQNFEIPTTRTREQIFSNDSNTCQSVIGQPEEINCLKNASENKQQKPVNYQIANEREQIFNPHSNQPEQQVYDSQMNSHYYKIQSFKMQVKCNKGFMNFSNASFLQSSKIQQQNQQTLIQQLNTQISECQSQPKSYSGKSELLSLNKDDISNINNRAPQLLNYSNPDNQNKQASQCKTRGVNSKEDSLSFSKYPSQNQINEDSEDNLFVQYRKRENLPQKDKNILIEQEQSESNLLSDTYHFPNSPQQMNSITFNLEANPDQQISQFKQSSIHIPVDSNEVQGTGSGDNDQKRQSELETNFRESADPSQVYSNHSQSQMSLANNNQKNHQEQQEIHQGINTMSIIQNLVNFIDYTININSVDSQDSDDQVQPHLDNIKNDQASKNSNKDSHKDLSEQNSQNIFVSYQAYTLNNQSQNEQNRKELEQPKQSTGYDHQELQETPVFYQCYKITSNEPNEHYTIQDKKQPDSVHNRFSSEYADEQKDYLHTNNESVECSAAFHQISEAYNQKPGDITFRKQHQQYQFNYQNLRNSNLLNELTNQAQKAPLQPQLLPGDYIYSTDRVQDAEEVLDSIISGFTSCF